MTRVFPLFVLVTAIGLVMADAPPPAVHLVLDDQFEKKRDLKDYRGDVVVVLYGDRKAMEANRALGEKIFVAYHPTAKGKQPAEARKAPPLPVPGLPEGARTPNVRLVPVACIGKVPDVVLTIIKREVKKASPDIPVWLDMGTTMKDGFGLRDAEPNLVVVDAEGRMRLKVLGEPDAKTTARMTEVIDSLRKEAAGVK